MGSFGSQTGKMTDAKEVQALADHGDCGLTNGLSLVKLVMRSPFWCQMIAHGGQDSLPVDM